MSKNRVNILWVMILSAAPTAEAWALIDEPNPPYNCRKGDNLRYYNFGYEHQDQEYDREWRNSGCSMWLQEPRSAASNPNTCDRAGRREAYDDWRLFLDHNCQNCEEEGDYAGYRIGRDLCNNQPYPEKQYLCTALAKYACENEAVWTIIYECKNELNYQPYDLRQQIEDLCRHDSTPPPPQCVSTQDELRSKLQNATDGETITVCQGTIDVSYKMSSTANGIHIKCEERRQCILKKVGSPKRVGSGRIFYLKGNNVTLEGLTFRDAKVVDRNGGAVYLKGYNNTVVNCRFDNNEAVNGGAIFAEKFTSITDSKFVNNHATGKGGAVYFVDRDYNLSNNQGKNNSASDCRNIYVESGPKCINL